MLHQANSHIFQNIFSITIDRKRQPAAPATNLLLFRINNSTLNTQTAVSDSLQSRKPKQQFGSGGIEPDNNPVVPRPSICGWFRGQTWHAALMPMKISSPSGIT
jgi:hypothetical protein